MVNWDRVQELRSKGWDWADIAKDPKVDFHPDASAGSPGRALRALYHRTGRRAQQVAAQETGPKRPRKEETERKWTLTRVGFLLVPLTAIWFALAYAAPSPVGLLVPAIPYLALALAAAAFILIYALWRKTEGPRWSVAYRRTVVVGVVLGLVVAGGIGLVSTLVFGCPVLPPGSSLSSVSSSGWSKVPVSAWQSGGKPVVYSYGSTWCPYCSATSWAIWKALSEYATVSSLTLGYSDPHDAAGPATPEIILAGASLSPKNGHDPAVDFQVSEDTSGVEPNVPGTSNCYQQAYVTAYASGVPFIVINGQYEHDGTLVSPLGPLGLSNWSNGQNGGASAVQGSVASESPAAQGGNPWQAVQQQAWWMMAFIAKILGTPVGTLASEYGWSANDLNQVTNDLNNPGL